MVKNSLKLTQSPKPHIFGIYGVKVNTQFKNLMIVWKEVPFVIFLFFLLCNSRILPIKTFLIEGFVASTLERTIFLSYLIKTANWTVLVYFPAVNEYI